MGIAHPDYFFAQLILKMTRNCDDFEELHEANPHHPGILVIYQNDDSSKDMSRQAIIQAIANFEAVVIPLSTAFIYA